MREGAYDYLVKPFSLDEVGLLVERVLEVHGLRQENRRLRTAVEEPGLLESASPAMQRVLATAHQVAASDVTLLLTGESGTGKNVLASAIHRWSPRRNGPFVTIACTTLAEHLLESELFGHVRGAFTGAWKDRPGRLEAARGGSLFLDEVGELPPELQAKLLRFLEERRFERVGGGETLEVDARIVAATNRDLEAEVRDGRFREDLFFRLNVIALRAARAARAPGGPAGAGRHHPRAPVRPPWSRVAHPGRRRARRARAYRWPGNVRELVNALERAVVLARGDTIGTEDLPDRLVAPALEGPPPPSGSSLEDLEQRHVRQVLAESSTLEEAAARLGINVTTLWRKRKRWRLD